MGLIADLPRSKQRTKIQRSPSLDDFHRASPAALFHDQHRAGRELHDSIGPAADQSVVER